MSGKEEGDAKRETLRSQRALNPHPQLVADSLFKEDEFFDRRDLVQVRYEMLRRVQAEGQPVTRSCRAFGISRPAFYQAQKAFRRGGLPGLVPRKRGPHHRHKMREEILDFLDGTVNKDPLLGSRELSTLVQERFGIRIHPRTIERGLSRRKKNRARRRRKTKR